MNTKIFGKLGKKVALGIVALLSVGVFALIANAAISGVSINQPDGTKYWRGVQSVDWIASGEVDDTLYITYSPDSYGGTSHPIVGPIPFDSNPVLWDTTSVVEGDGTYNVRLQNNDGTEYKTSVQFNIDNTAPNTVIFPSPSVGWWNILSSAPTITLTCTDPTVGGVASGCSDIKYAWYNTTSSAVVVASTTVAITPIVAPQGDNILVYFSEDNAVDKDGNHNVEDTQSMEFKVDTDAPDAPVITSIAGDDYINFYEATSTVVTGTAEANSKILMNLSDGTSYADATTTVDGSGNFTATLDTTTAVSFALTDGTITATVTAVDEAENVSPSATKDAIKDTITPVTSGAPDLTDESDTGDSNTDNTTNDNTPDYYVAPCEVGTTVTIYATSTPNGSAQCVATDDDEIGSATVTTNLTLDGTYNVSFTETDTAGNESDKSTALPVTIDTSAPDAPTVDAITDDSGTSSSDGITNDTDLMFNGTAPTDATSVEIFINGSSIGTTTASGGTWTFNYTGTTLSDDSYGVTAKASDVAGNQSEASTVFNLVIDTTAPDAPVIDSVATDDIINAAEENSAIVAGTAEENTSVEVIINDGVHTPITATDIATGGTFSISVDTTPLNEGSLTVTANTTDIAGNISPDTADYNVTKDIVAPNVDSITTKDMAADGFIDTATIVFNEPVLDSSFGSATGFTIGGFPATGIFTDPSTGGVVDDETVNITIGTGVVAGTDAKDVTYTPGAVTDLAGNPLGAIASSDIAETDGASPKLLSAKTTSQTTIDATFSEKIKSTTINGTGTEFALSGGYTVSNATENSDGVVTLTVSTMPTGATPDVTFTNSGTFTDTTGNEAVTPTTVTATDGVAPDVTSVSISSDNNTYFPLSTLFPKTGNIATITFTSDEKIQTPTVMIDGQSATVSNTSGDEINWTATYTFTGIEDEGNVPFTINYQDIAGNSGPEKTTTTTGPTFIAYDKTSPTVDAGTDKEVNIPTTQEATVYDKWSGPYYWEWSQVSGPGTVLFSNPSSSSLVLPASATSTADTIISADTDGTYTVKLDGIDTAGNTSSDTMTFIWDTTAPAVETSVPYDNVTGVATTTGVAKIVFYSGSGNIVLVDASKVTLKDNATGDVYSTGVNVEGGDGNSTTLNINYSPLIKNTVYRINIAPGALRDVAGNMMTANFVSRFTTTDLPIPADTTAPDAPVINTTADTVDANYYTITGTVADDGEQRIVNLYNGSVIAGTAVLATGDTNWTINAALTQNADNVFTATATDGVGNESSASNSVTITEADPIAVIPTLEVIGDPIVSSYTQSEANTRFDSGLRFNITNATSFTINGNSKTITSTVTAKTKADATTLGSHIYNVVVTSSTGDTANILLNYEVTADVEDIVIDDIVAVSSSATADDTYANGWHYIYKITVNTSETDLLVKFADWLRIGGSGTVPANGNMRLLFNTATGNGLGSSVGAIPETDIVNGFGTVDSYEIGKDYADQKLGGTAQNIDISGLDASTRAGRQVQFDVYTKLSSTTPAGFYKTEYGIKTL